jgi:hypothetical protein
VFIQGYNWKRKLFGAAGVALLSLCMSLSLSGQAVAAGEQYRWVDAAKLAIIASGGNYAKDTTFVESAPTDSTGHTFTATNASYKCGSTTKTGTLKFFIDSTAYQSDHSTTKAGVVGASCVFDPPVVTAAAAPPDTTPTDPEQYNWKDDTKQSVVASSGNFGANTITFAETATDKTKGYTFTAKDVSYQCVGQTKKGTLSFVVSPTAYQADHALSGGLLGAAAGCGFAVPVVEAAAPATSSPAVDCNSAQGDVSWVVCPLITNISTAILTTAQKALMPLLRVNRITPTTTPDLYNAWKGVRDLTEVLIILVFFIIIASTLLQQDIAMFNKYTVKKTLPKLVIASILIHFSFLFSGLIVDGGNVLGGGVSAVLSISHDAANPSSTYVIDHIDKTVGLFNAAGAGLTGAALAVYAFFTPWTLALPMLAMIFLSILAVFITLAARFLFLAVLIVLSPLALLAWVLPGTEKWFKKWFSIFTNLVMMYPMIMLILTLAGSITQLLGGVN